MKLFKGTMVMAALLLTAGVLMAQDGERLYEMKSGIVRSVATFMGQTVEATTYFDDYGLLEAVISKASGPGGVEIEMAAITKDGKSYMVDYSANKVEEVPVEESVNYLSLTPEIIEKYDIRDLGVETVGEWECSKYSQKVVQKGHRAKMTVWVWKGITIRTVTSILGIKMTTETVELIENAVVPPEIFELPAL